MVMRALTLSDVGTAPAIQQVPSPTQIADTVKVRITHAALNRRDVWITKGKYPNIKTPSILGSDGVGVLETASGTLSKGTRVVIYPGQHWGQNQAVQSHAYEILGMPSQGTFAEEIVVPKSLVYEAPSHLTDAEAAALPLAGLTAWRSAFTRGSLQKGEHLLVTGIGGGVASIAAQFGIAAGAYVHVSSSSDDKNKAAIEMGCTSGLRYDDTDFDESLKRCTDKGFDVVVDGAGGNQVGAILKTMAPAGRFVFYGGTAGKWPAILPQRLFYKQVSILASTMGSPQDFEAMLAFVSRHQIRPLVDRVFDLESGAEAFRYLEGGAQMGKVVLSIG